MATRVPPPGRPAAGDETPGPRFHTCRDVPSGHSHKKTPSAPDSSTRRHSLPPFLPPILWNANASAASLVESEAAARGEHIRDEQKAAHRISALRQLNGTSKAGHRYAKSAGARNSTFNQPVIVRTYSGGPRSRSRQCEPAYKRSNMAKAELPPIEAFTFRGIMDSIQHGVADDLERIAEICARSRYSLSNQYEVHMPPHGQTPLLQTPGQAVQGGQAGQAIGPTPQAIGSDNDHTRRAGKSGRRRTKSAAYGTLETIMSSSRSSEEDESKKKPAAQIAEKVRGRAATKISQSSAGTTEPASNESTSAVAPDVVQQRPPKRIRSKSATFASMIIDSAQSIKHDSRDPSSHLVSPAQLISEPARPQTSAALELPNTRLDDSITTVVDADAVSSPTLGALLFPKPSLISNDSRASTLRADRQSKTSIRGGLSSWIPWPRLPSAIQENRAAAGARRTSHAEGSLRELLKAAGTNKKGKGIEQPG